MRRRCTRRRCRARRRSTIPTARWSTRCRPAARARRAAALAAGADAVARRRLGRLRRPAPEPRAAGLRRAGAGRRRSASPRSTSVRYLRAHHLGGFTWLLRDRLEDGQVAEPTTSCSSWPRSSIGAGARRWPTATGDAALADAALPPRRRALAARDARRAARARARGRCARRSTRRSCARSWAGSACRRRRCCWRSGDPRRVTAFLHAHDLFLLGLQAIDDVIDANAGSRAARRRRSERARLLAGRAGAGRRRSWCSGRRRPPRTAASPGSRPGSRRSRTRSAPGASTAIALGDELDAIGIAGEIEEAVLSAAETPIRASAAAGARRGRTGLSSRRGLRTGARVERAPVACPSAATLGGPWCAPRARPRRAWWPLARIGAVDLYLAPPGQRARRAGAVRHAGRRGQARPPGQRRLRRRRRARPDRRVRRRRRRPRRAAARARIRRRRRRARPRLAGRDPRRGRRRRRSTTSRALPARRRRTDPRRPARRRRRPRPRARRRSAPVTAPQMAGVVLAECPARARRPVPDRGRRRAPRGPTWRRSISPRRSRPRSAAGGPTSCSIAMSDGAWGTPRYLRDVLREAARRGRGGRGTAIFCSVGDPSRNHARQDDSAALGADDLASQPWVQAIAACDATAAGTASIPGTTARARATAASGAGRDLQPLRARRSRWRRWASRGAGASTSPPTTPARRPRWRRPPRRASSTQNRELSAAELRALLALTADVPAAVDGGRGLGGRRLRRARSPRSQLQDRLRRGQRRAPPAWPPPIRSASRCSRRARCPTPAPARVAGRSALAQAWRRRGAAAPRGRRRRAGARLRCASPGASAGCS